MKKLLLSLAFLSLVACKDDDNRFFELGEFRVLAVQADTPEIDGTSVTPIAVTLTPFVSDINAGGRLLSINILACPDPGLQLGNDPVCDTNSAATQTIAYTSVSSSTLGARRTGAMPSFVVNVPPGLLTGQNNQTKFNGLDYIVTMQFKAGEDAIDVYRRITVSERATKNTNPGIENVLLNGNVSGSVQDGDKLSLDLLAGTGEETYDYEDIEGVQSEKTETYTASWFTYKGTTDIRRTFVNEKAVFEIEPGQSNPFVVAILRDDRGGIDFKLKE